MASGLQLNYANAKPGLFGISDRQEMLAHHSDRRQHAARVMGVADRLGSSFVDCEHPGM
jgi:hypothetical protein